MLRGDSEIPHFLAMYTQALSEDASTSPHVAALRALGRFADISAESSNAELTDYVASLRQVTGPLPDPCGVHTHSLRGLHFASDEMARALRPQSAARTLEAFIEWYYRPPAAPALYAVSAAVETASSELDETDCGGSESGGKDQKNDCDGRESGGEVQKIDSDGAGASVSDRGQ